VAGLAVAVINAVWLTPAAVKTTTVAPSVIVSAASPSPFAATVPNTSGSPSVTPTGMVWIPGGEFSMGAQDPPGMDQVGMQAIEDSRPVHRVYVDGFWMDRTDVTNAQFAEFVKATGYVTVAERKPRAEEYPGAPPGNLIAGSVVFSPPDHMGAAERPLPVVELRARRELAAAAWPE
jgi:formylglycine-generating enzyme required for sulfatase activity